MCSKPPFYYSKARLLNKMHLSLEQFNYAIDLLDNISAISVKDDKLKINFPFFIKKDIVIIKKIVRQELNKNLDFFEQNFVKLYEVSKNLYPDINAKTSLYHLLCGKLFDGNFFNYLEKQNFLKVSYPKKGNRDYVVIGYEDNWYCNRFNNSLICSFNNARFQKSSLSSFGTPSGSRIDYFRYFKIREKNKVPIKYLKLHKLFSNIDSQTILQNTINLIKDIKNNKNIKESCYSRGLKITNYISRDCKIKAPVFDNYIEKVNVLYDVIVELIGDKILQGLNNIKDKIINSKLNVINHCVNIDEICNEVWHIYFGMLNRCFVNMNLVKKPRKYLTQGEYLKCIYINL